MTMQRCRLVDAVGDDLGPFVTKTARWKPGDRIYRSSEGDLIVLRVVEADTADNVDGYLVVEPAEVESWEFAKNAASPVDHTPGRPVGTPEFGRP